MIFSVELKYEKAFTVTKCLLTEDERANVDITQVNKNFHMLYRQRYRIT